MIALRRYYESDEDFQQIHQMLGLTPCPHCRRVGTLILHGYLRGYPEGEASERTLIRGRRIFCTGRHRRAGCGRTVGVLRADLLRNFIMTALTLWQFLCVTVTETATGKLRMSDGRRGAHHLLRRVRQSQSRIRSALLQHVGIPEPPSTEDPLHATLAHLLAAFPHVCPIVEFQHRFQISFL